MPKTVTGTSYFKTRIRAIRYYCEQEPEGEDNLKRVEEAVDAKLAAGEIHIGIPTTGKGQTVCLMDRACRYGIVEET